MKTSLTEIANKYGTDKGSSSYECHNYTCTYESYLEVIREDKLKLLEIGVYDIRFPGASVKMWKEYFTNLEYYGFDIIQESKRLEEDGVKIFIGDQNNPDDLKSFILECGGEFDVIIDDGFHTHSHHITSFTNLSPYLKTGGLYFIEDLHANDSYNTVQWFIENNIPYELTSNGKLLIYKKG